MRVCVEGNIGCGKSTALALLQDGRPDVRVFQEPVDEWKDMLGKFYDDPATWALPFSLKVLLSFNAPGKLTAPADKVLVERSPLSCRHVFSQLMFNEGKMTQEQWDIFKEYCDVLAWTPDVIVYVHVPADVCHRRMLQRGRPEELGVDLSYLKRLEFQYDIMLRYADVPVVRVDGTLPPEAVATRIADVLDGW